MAIFSSGNDTVDLCGQIDLSTAGAFNQIPENWYSVLRFPSGVVNLAACVILSEIWYWYRPTVELDEFGHAKKFKKKFDSDVLQKSYSELANKFGLTKRQVSDAIKYLESLDLVKREFRTVITESKLSLGNVLFIHLNVERVVEITYPGLVKPLENTEDDTLSRLNVIGVTSESDRGHVQTSEGSRSNVIGAASKRETYTKTTTKTTTKITTSSPNSNILPIKEKGVERKSYRDLIAENIHLSSLLQEAVHDSDKKRIQMLYEIMCKTVNSKAKTIRINSEDMPTEVVKSQFLKIGWEEIHYVCDVLDTPPEKPIKSLEGYIKTLLYNSRNLIDEYWNQQVLYHEYGGGREKKNKPGFNDIPQRDYDFEELERKLLEN